MYHVVQISIYHHRVSIDKFRHRQYHVVRHPIVTVEILGHCDEVVSSLPCHMHAIYGPQLAQLVNQAFWHLKFNSHGL